MKLTHKVYFLHPNAESTRIIRDSQEPSDALDDNRNDKFFGGLDKGAKS